MCYIIRMRQTGFQLLSIIPFGSVRKELLELLQIELANTFGLGVRIFKEQATPHYAFSAKRNQYHSTEILEKLRQVRIEDELILGVADVDLYVPELNFVFGEADIFSGVCIISLVRLRQKYYGLPENEKLFFERAVKEAIHEIGHTYRLGHCKDPKCIMHFSNSIQDTDRKGPGFCNTCKTKIGL
ncbi:MAG: hypothetical protein E3K32_09525 [wastewater metagenome]|nr:hypothetical protein [Candidatus Loosdrechtia aerotolerans]